MNPYILDISDLNRSGGDRVATRPISFVVVRFSDEYLYNFAISECSQDDLNEVILVDNTANLYFDSLSQAMAKGISRATHDLIVVVHEDVLLPKGWQGYFEQSLSNLEQHDKHWGVLGSVGWEAGGKIFGHWKDPRNFMNSFAENPNGWEPAQRLDEQILILQKRTLPALDMDLPGIHHIGRGLLASAVSEGHSNYIIDAPTIHKYADKKGKLVEKKEDSEKILDRQTRPYLADRACCNDYIVHRWPELDVSDYEPVDFTIPFGDEKKLEQLDSPVILLGRGGSGTRLLGVLAHDAGIFTGDNINRPMDSLDMVKPVYRGIIEKYRCPADWQKAQAVPRIRSGAAQLIKGIPHGQQWGFKMPESILLLPELARAFPNARYVHFVRDPLATCLRRTHLTARLSNHLGRIAIPLAYDYYQRPRSKILRDSPALHMAYTTMHQLSLVFDFVKELPDSRQYSVRFENVISDPVGQVNAFCEWFGQNAVENVLENTVDADRAKIRNDEYKSEIVDLLVETLKPLRMRLGYGLS